MTILGASNTFTGPAEALEIVGEHAYAYSGAVTTVGTGSANTRTLKFTSGNYYFVGTLTFYNDEVGGPQQYVDMQLNGISIIAATWDGNSANIDEFPPIPVIIPPYTEVEVLVGVSASSDVWTTQLVGRVYRD